MRDAKLNGKPVLASPDSPEVALCPACGGEVHKHRRKVGRSEVTYFYRHRAGVGDGCPRRYRPVPEA
ncbi:MAG: hypothetical protein IMY86_06950 [Chloroflexi bacterium]|nr:hypothetical protein [Chloroflexota bacterium]